VGLPGTPGKWVWSWASAICSRLHGPSSSPLSQNDRLFGPRDGFGWCITGGAHRANDRISGTFMAAGGLGLVECFTVGIKAEFLPDHLSPELASPSAVMRHLSGTAHLCGSAEDQPESPNHSVSARGNAGPQRIVALGRSFHSLAIPDGSPTSTNSSASNRATSQLGLPVMNTPITIPRHPSTDLVGDSNPVPSRCCWRLD